MQPSRSIYVNPKFKSAHINPMFLVKNPPRVEVKNVSSSTTQKAIIFINPNFIPKNVQPQPENAPIITKTRRKIVRQAAIPLKPLVIPDVTMKLPVKSSNMMKIGRNKLIRIKTPESVVNKAQRSSSRFNLVRRISSSDSIAHKRFPAVATDSRQSIVKKYFLCRQNPKPTRVVIDDKKLMRIGSNTVRYRTNNSLEFLNINGVLYKSTANKLEKKSFNPITPQTKVEPKIKSNRFLFVRGDKFILEANGKSLKRIGSIQKVTSVSSEFKRKRIDIGGLTYIAKNDSTFEQTGYHLSRTHLSVAKTKSLNVLARKYSKSNIPCPIFRRLGKCLADDRGRCPKVHDKKHVMICPKYLKGECSNDNCLLSHDVNLSKMPTCKFFLQGCCFKTDCPYLHKKLNENVDVCEEFLKGFCLLADRCSKRHDIVKSTKSSSDQLCTWLERQGVCLEKNCPYNHEKDKVKNRTNVPTTSSSSSTKRKDVGLENGENLRYFIQNSNEEETESENHKNCVRKRKLSNTLPSYIPL